MARKTFSFFFFLGYIDNRYGCLIIALIESCWLLSSLVLSFRALYKSQGDWMLRTDYYLGLSSDTESIVYGAVGIVSPPLQLSFTAMLVYVAATDGRRNSLLVVYMLKNLVVIPLDVMILSIRWIVPYKRGLIQESRFDVAVIVTVFMGVVVPVYASFIAFVHNRQLNKRINLGKRLHAAQDAYEEAQKAQADKGRTRKNQNRHRR